MTTIRVATEADAEEILAIYAKYIEQTAITFEYVVPSIDCLLYTSPSPRDTR